LRPITSLRRQRRLRHGVSLVKVSD
jgi:hypothetical protein